MAQKSRGGLSRERRADLVVVGGGLGGVSAALAALEGGATVILTEETAWLGGQLTSQAVPPDENPWIEDFGGSRSYREMRTRIREYYRRNYPLTEVAKATPYLNPGNGRVSRICHEPRVALAVIEELLAPFATSGRLVILRRHTPVAAEVDGDSISAVTVLDRQSGENLILQARFFIDATELGEVLQLAGVEHVMGSESQSDTGEPQALLGEAEPLDQQSFTVCFALDYHPDGDFTIDRPAEYDFWSTYQASFWPGRQLGWQEVYPDTLQPHSRAIFSESGGSSKRDASDLWHFRRILDESNFEPESGIQDVTLVNWQAIDYWLGPLVGVSAEEAASHESRARQLSLSYLYWMQTEAPRHDGGTGYSGLRLRGDLLGNTPDGLAMSPYIRESRRIIAETRVVEQDISVQARKGDNGAEVFHDSIGVGSYRIDLHPSSGGSRGPRTFVDVDTYPFQIPLGALIPVRVANLLPAAKNIGTTHITNGCYRLHPIEWSIGEASGALAALCLRTGESPRGVRNSQRKLADFQHDLVARRGVTIEWPEAIRTRLEYY